MLTLDHAMMLTSQGLLQCVLFWCWRSNNNKSFQISPPAGGSKARLYFCSTGGKPFNHFHCTPQDLVAVVHSMTSAILSQCPTVRRVFWGKLLQRLSPRIPPGLYYERLLEINSLLPSLPISKLTVWPHHGFCRNTHKLYSADGIHLNYRGQQLLARSIRGAILPFKASVEC